MFFCFSETWGRWMEDLNKWFLIVLSAFKNNGIDSLPRKKTAICMDMPEMHPEMFWKFTIQSFTQNFMLPTSCHSNITFPLGKEIPFDVTV